MRNFAFPPLFFLVQMSGEECKNYNQQLVYMRSGLHNLFIQTFQRVWFRHLKPPHFIQNHNDRIPNLTAVYFVQMIRELCQIL